MTGRSYRAFQRRQSMHSVDFRRDQDHGATPAPGPDQSQPDGFWLAMAAGAFSIGVCYVRRCVGDDREAKLRSSGVQERLRRCRPVTREVSAAEVRAIIHRPGHAG